MKAIEFSMEVTWDKTDLDDEDIFNLIQQAEDNRRATATRVCAEANVGLNIRVFADHTEYYMDTNHPGGYIHEETYGGVEDLRDQDHYA